MSVWVAGVSAAVGLYSAYQQKQSAKNAANAQIDAANAANANQTGLYNKQTQLMAPWRNAGASSIGYLSYLMGVPGYEKWTPTSNMGTTAPKPQAAQVIPHVSGGSFLPDPLGVGSMFGLAAHPATGQDGSTATGGYGPPNQNGLGASNGLPRFNSPMDAGFQQLPSGSQFMGPDGIVRRKH